MDFNPLWNYIKRREDVFKLHCLYFDGKFGGRKWKTSITSVKAHRSANSDETNQSDSKKEESFRA